MPTATHTGAQVISKTKMAIATAFLGAAALAAAGVGGNLAASKACSGKQTVKVTAVSEKLVPVKLCRGNKLEITNAENGEKDTVTVRHYNSQKLYLLDTSAGKYSYAMFNKSAKPLTFELGPEKHKYVGYYRAMLSDGKALFYVKLGPQPEPEAEPFFDSCGHAEDYYGSLEDIGQTPFEHCQEEGELYACFNKISGDFENCVKSASECENLTSHAMSCEIKPFFDSCGHAEDYYGSLEDIGQTPFEHCQEEGEQYICFDKISGNFEGCSNQWGDCGEQTDYPLSCENAPFFTSCDHAKDYYNSADIGQTPFEHCAEQGEQYVCLNHLNGHFEGCSNEWGSCETQTSHPLNCEITPVGSCEGPECGVEPEDPPQDIEFSSCEEVKNSDLTFDGVNPIDYCQTGGVQYACFDKKTNTFEGCQTDPNACENNAWEPLVCETTPMFLTCEDVKNSDATYEGKNYIDYCGDGGAPYVCVDKYSGKFAKCELSAEDCEDNTWYPLACETTPKYTSCEDVKNSDYTYEGKNPIDYCADMNAPYACLDKYTGSLKGCQLSADDCANLNTSYPLACETGHYACTLYPGWSHTGVCSGYEYTCYDPDSGNMFGCSNNPDQCTWNSASSTVACNNA